MKILLFIILCCTSLVSHSAVILQYHHVSENTPASTSVTPQQFKIQLQYLHEHNFTIVPLSKLVDAIKSKKKLADKTVAITFDDAFLDILINAKPILDSFDYPFTIFINPAVVNRKAKKNLTWQQLKQLANDGVIIANHGFEHNSLARKPSNMSNSTWLNLYGKSLEKAEDIIQEKTGKSWRYFAYPYGEYSYEALVWLRKNNFIGFSQQSGAVGIYSDLSALPRFPASHPYDKLTSLTDKLNSLAVKITATEQPAQFIFKYQQIDSINFTFDLQDINKARLSCYITGIGKQKISWQNDNSFTLYFNKPLPIGRVRSNCTAPSRSKLGRFYWYSHPWFILKQNGDWYPL